MSINFQAFLEITGFTAPYAARKILYFPKSRPALMAVNLGLDIDGQRSEMVSFVNGSKKTNRVIMTDSNFRPESSDEYCQLEVMDTNISHSQDTNATSESI